MFVKVASCLSAVFLAASLCLGPYAGAAYAWAQLVIPAGRALLAVCAVLGLSVNISSDEDVAAFWSDFELYTDDLDALATSVGQLQDAAIDIGAANGQLVNATKSEVSQQQVDAIKDVFAAAGQAGTFALDQLSILASDGVLGILPFILSGFIADAIAPDLPADGTHAILSGIQFSFAPMGREIHNASYGFKAVLVGTYKGSPIYVIGTTSMQTVADKVTSILFTQISATSNLEAMFATGVSGASFPYNSQLSTSNFGTSLRPDFNGSWPSISAPLSSDFVLNSSYDLYFKIPHSGVALISECQTCIGGVCSPGIVTDNPDVNLGHDWWSDAKDRADVLNPATGAAVIGSDAVIDGDYIKSRGSIAIPTDWADINSWADALARTHAGVIEGAIDGTISGTMTGTAVDVGTGELVTDTVESLTRPGSGTSVAAPLAIDFAALSGGLADKFPFCLPGDLNRLFGYFVAAPVAPHFTWSFWSPDGDIAYEVDLSQFDSVAAICRTGMFVSLLLGLVFVVIRLINMLRSAAN